MIEQQISGPCSDPYELPVFRPVSNQQIADGLKASRNKGEALTILLSAASSHGLLTNLDANTREKLASWKL